MMMMERRALYNLLRMNWLRDPSQDVEEWQVADYRNMGYNELFQHLYDRGIDLDANAFQQIAEEFDTPEELSDVIFSENDFDASDEDAIYLLLFELWRRLFAEIPCLSVFCDELDHQIFLFDNEEQDNPEAIEDVLSNLQVVLDENADESGKPLEVFQMVASNCANDVESFLYDFISEQIDHENHAYALDLLEGFEPYLSDQKWVDFLRSRVIVETDPEESKELLQQVVKRAIKDENIEFNFEVLAFLVQEGEEGSFQQLAKKTLELIRTEDNFHEFLALAADYFSCIDLEEKERQVQIIIDSRINRADHEKMDPNDPEIDEVRKLLGC